MQCKIHIWILLGLLLIDGFHTADSSFGELVQEQLRREAYAEQILESGIQGKTVPTFQHLINEISIELESFKEKERTEREKLQMTTESYNTT